MAHIICGNCGMENDSDERFCTRCDVYLAWDDGTLLKTPGEQPNIPVTQTEQPRGKPPQRTDTAALPPQVSVSVTDATLDALTPARFELEIRNVSRIVDAYRVDMVGAPPWLAIAPAEARVLPDESATLAAVLSMRPGPPVPSQTVDVTLRVTSLRDTSRFVYTGVSVTVERTGAALKLEVRPALIRLVDDVEGRAQILLDNSGSNYGRRIALTASDDQGIVRFMLAPQTVDVGPGGRAQAELRFRAPELTEGADETRQVKIEGAHEEGSVEANLTIQQRRSASTPLLMRLEPALVRVRDRYDGQLNLLVDNRNGRQPRTIALQGRDPEGVIRFNFTQPTVTVPPGQVASVRVGVWGPLPEPAQEVQRPFSIVATEHGHELESAGTLAQATSPPKPVKKSNWPKWVLAALVLAAAAAATVFGFRYSDSPNGDDAQAGGGGVTTTRPTSGLKPRVTTTTTTTTAAPEPGPQTLLPVDDGIADNVVFVETKTGDVRCQVLRDTVSCEGDFDGAPDIDGVTAHIVLIAPGGRFQWVVGGFGDDQAVSLDYTVYQAEGWTITAEPVGTTFRNDRTGRGVFVSLGGVHPT